VIDIGCLTLPPVDEDTKQKLLNMDPGHHYLTLTFDYLFAVITDIL